jgi:hypothetical protein
MSKVYFGTRERMIWVKPPAINTPLSGAGIANTGTDLNGGGYSKMSPTAHKEYQFTWGASPAKDIYDVTDYRSGVYGTGLLYYLDPFAMESNALSSAFSAPSTLCTIGRMGGTYSTPTGSRVDATNLATNPSFEAAGTTVEVRRNLCANASFEVNTNGWSPSAATATVSSDYALFGTKSAKVIPTAGNTGSGDLRSGNSTAMGFGVETGKTYTFSAWIYTPVAHTTFSTDAGSRQRRILTWYSVDGSSFISSFGPQAPNTVGWHRISHTVTVPANSTGFVLAVGCAGSLADVDFVTYVDGVLLEEGSTLSEYFDGSHSPDPDLTPSYTGLVNASESILSGVRPAKHGDSGAGTRCYQSQAWVADGNVSLCIDGRGATGKPEFVVADQTSNYQYQLQAGKTYTAVAWLRLDEVGNEVLNSQRCMNFYWSNNGGATYTEVKSDKAANGAGVTLIRFTFTVPSDADRSILRLGGHGWTERAWWDGFTIVEGSRPDLMPFNGNTPNSNGYTYAWSGSANASTSVRTIPILSNRYTGTHQPLPVTVTSANSAKHYIPCPPLHQIWVSYVASANILRANGTTLTRTEPTATTPLWHTYSDGVELHYQGTGNLWGSQVLVLPMGDSPHPEHEWQLGKGHSGLRFSGEPQIVGISAVLNGRHGLVNGTVNFKETGLWE